MNTGEADQRNRTRRALGERATAEPKLGPLDVPNDAPSAMMTAHLARRRRRPVAVAGIVEKGLVRPVDPAGKLPENSRVVIAASEQTRAASGEASGRPRSRLDPRRGRVEYAMSDILFLHGYQSSPDYSWCEQASAQLLISQQLLSLHCGTRCRSPVGCKSADMFRLRQQLLEP